MAPKLIQTVLKLVGITNGTPANGDVWRDEADGQLKYHDKGATHTLLTNAAESGGTYYKLTADFTNTDATSTPEDVTGMSFAVEANRNYWLEGAMLWHDSGSSGNQSTSLVLPSGATFTFYQNSISEAGFITHDGWMDDYNAGYGAGLMGNTQGGNTFSKFHGILRVAGTAGTVQLQFTNLTGDSSEMGIRKGSFIRVQS